LQTYWKMQDNNFFDDSLFDEEAVNEVIEVDNEQLGDDFTQPQQPKDDGKIDEHYILMAQMFIGGFDETRSLIFSLISGEPPEKYLFYKRKNSKGDFVVSKDSDMVTAAAMVAKKYGWEMGPEYILGLGLLASSAFLTSEAMKDRKKNKHQKALKDEQPI
jgi:hypothetical protein